MYGFVFEFEPNKSLSLANFGSIIVFDVWRFWILLSHIGCTFECKNADDDFVIKHAAVSSVVCTSLSGDEEMSAMIPLSVEEIEKHLFFYSKLGIRNITHW